MIERFNSGMPGIDLDTTEIGQVKQSGFIFTEDIIYFSFNRFRKDFFTLYPRRRFSTGILLKKTLILYSVRISFQRFRPSLKIWKNDIGHPVVIRYNISLCKSFARPKNLLIVGGPEFYSSESEDTVTAFFPRLLRLTFHFFFRSLFFTRALPFHRNLTGYFIRPHPQKNGMTHFAVPRDLRVFKFTHPFGPHPGNKSVRSRSEE